MMKISWKVIGPLVVVCTLIWIFLIPGPRMTSMTSMFTVIDKVETQGKLEIIGYNPNYMQDKQVKILMEDRSEWNQIVKNESYIITYTQKENEQPVFVEFVRERR
ncbi:hypothetical protein CBW65_23580 [Tumebacillus avium]|uniref:Uncharacterized protein n=2 Tax=Tumebacillus avium TaxID=1903704 RepID=A0A1Y0IV46_9BACL|nr:hypothetical protein CBW65_23580 [Tumebacillus avium]